MNVRVWAIGLTAMAHLLALLVFSVERRLQRADATRKPPQFVSIWSDSTSSPPLQRQRKATTRPHTTAALVPRANLLAVAPQVSAAPGALLPTPLSAAPDPARPLVSWAAESQSAAARIAANEEKADTFSPPPDINLPARLCTPREINEATQAKMDKLLPPPAEPSSPPRPPDGLLLPGGVRVGFIRFSTPVGRRTARPNFSDHLKKMRPVSSIPDPDTCD